eukprot:s1850_g5.t1
MGNEARDGRRATAAALRARRSCRRVTNAHWSSSDIRTAAEQGQGKYQDLWRKECQLVQDPHWRSDFLEQPLALGASCTCLAPTLVLLDGLCTWARCVVVVHGFWEGGFRFKMVALANNNREL